VESESSAGWALLASLSSGASLAGNPYAQVGAYGHWGPTVGTGTYYKVLGESGGAPSLTLWLLLCVSRSSWHLWEKEIGTVKEDFGEERGGGLR
jgi:hypothetical protein